MKKMDVIGVSTRKVDDLKTRIVITFSLAIRPDAEISVSYDADLKPGVPMIQQDWVRDGLRLLAQAGQIAQDVQAQCAEH